jgi:hypothetical protein
MFSEREKKKPDLKTWVKSDSKNKFAIGFK